MNATISLRASEYLSEETLEAAEDAADVLIDQMIDDLLNEGVKDTTRNSRVKVGRIRGIRTRSGSFISAINLHRLLQISLHDYVKDLMGDGTRLNYVTGRLAHSADILSLEEVGDTISLMFSYMIYPYATFEKGGRQYKPGRDPSELIDAAIDKALADLIHPDSLNRFVISFSGG